MRSKWCDHSRVDPHISSIYLCKASPPESSTFSVCLSFLLFRVLSALLVRFVHFRNYINTFILLCGLWQHRNERFGVCCNWVKNINSVVMTSDLRLWRIQVPYPHNTHVVGGHVSLDGSGGDPESACVWDLWHVLLWSGEWKKDREENQYNCGTSFTFQGLQFVVWHTLFRTDV